MHIPHCSIELQVIHSLPLDSTTTLQGIRINIMSLFLFQLPFECGLTLEILFMCVRIWAVTDMCVDKFFYPSQHIEKD